MINLLYHSLWKSIYIETYLWIPWRGLTVNKMVVDRYHLDENIIFKLSSFTRSDSLSVANENSNIQHPKSLNVKNRVSKLLTHSLSLLSIRASLSKKLKKNRYLRGNVVNSWIPKYSDVTRVTMKFVNIMTINTPSLSFIWYITSHTVIYASDRIRIFLSFILILPVNEV